MVDAFRQQGSKGRRWLDGSLSARLGEGSLSSGFNPWAVVAEDLEFLVMGKRSPLHAYLSGTA